MFTEIAEIIQVVFKHIKTIELLNSFVAWDPCFQQSLFQSFCLQMMYKHNFVTKSEQKIFSL